MIDILKTSSLALLLTLGACSPPLNIEQARTADRPDDPYASALYEGYRTQLEAELAEGDWRDGQRFAEKVLLVATSGDALPDNISSRKLKKRHIGALAEARARLTKARQTKARSFSPNDLARAQVQFDCWMQEQEEDWQRRHIEACRNGFERAMGRVEYATAKANAEEIRLARLAMIRPSVGDAAKDTKPIKPVQPTEKMKTPGPWLVFFEFDSAELAPEARAILKRAADTMDEPGLSRIHVTGHADRAGSEAYNAKLSLRRAEAVTDFLVAAGVERRHIIALGKGELEPVAPSADNQRDPANRRVEVLAQFKDIRVVINTD